MALARLWGFIGLDVDHMPPTKPISNLQDWRQCCPLIVPRMEPSPMRSPWFRWLLFPFLLLNLAASIARKQQKLDFLELRTLTRWVDKSLLSTASAISDAATASCHALQPNHKSQSQAHSQRSLFSDSDVETYNSSQLFASTHSMLQPFISPVHEHFAVRGQYMLCVPWACQCLLVRHCVFFRCRCRPGRARTLRDELFIQEDRHRV